MLLTRRILKTMDNDYLLPDEGRPMLMSPKSPAT